MTLVRHKALAYITRAQNGQRELLVLEHRDHPEAGLQVPGGSIDKGETPEQAALREAFEESGLSNLKVSQLLCNYSYNHPLDKGAIHNRYVFHLELTEPVADTWSHAVSDGEGDKGLVFLFRWIPLDSSKELAVGQGDCIGLLKNSESMKVYSSDLEECLRADSLRLEPILFSHAARLFEKMQAPELYTFIPINPPRSLEALENRYLRLSKRHSDDGTEIWLNYAVFSDVEKDYVGTVQATVKNGDRTYIAYEVFPSFWRRGFAKAACRELINFIFFRFKVEAISALMDTRNTASWNLLESLHFKRISFIKNADEFKGSVSDEYLYEMQKNSWERK